MRPSSSLPALERTRAIVLALFTFALAGCAGEDPMGPVTLEDGLSSPQGAVQSFAGDDAVPEEECHTRPQVREFYPLKVGNSWRYSHLLRLTTTGTGSGEDPLEFHATVDRELIGTESLSERQYVVEEERFIEGDQPEDTFLAWTRYRQDRQGLYYLNICTCTPPDLEGDAEVPVVAARLNTEATSRPASDVFRGRVSRNFSAPFARAWERHASLLAKAKNALSVAPQAIDGARKPGGPDEDENQLLRYPLRPGSSWVVSTEIGLTWTVEQLVLLRLPAGRFPAYRIRVRFPGLSATDRLYIWYGPAGRLAHRIHATTEVTDDQGNPIGTFVADEIQKLESLSIARR
jgi:hypothetical protein